VAHIQLVALWQMSCALRNHRRGLDNIPSTSLLHSIFQGYLLQTKMMERQRVKQGTYEAFFVVVLHQAFPAGDLSLSLSRTGSSILSRIASRKPVHSFLSHLSSPLRAYFPSISTAPSTPGLTRSSEDTQRGSSETTMEICSMYETTVHR
jgi:hypothetical protein